MRNSEIHPIQESIQKSVQKQVEEQAEIQMQKEIEMRTRIISAAYDRAATYTNLIILAGYAGSFTLWSFTKEYLTQSATIVVALMLGISLFVFCGWEVYKMIKTSSQLRRIVAVLYKGLQPEKFLKELQQVELENKKHTVILYRSWYVVLLVTILSGFGGVLILFYNFAAILIGWRQWPV